MRGIQFIPHNTNIDFVGKKMFIFAFSIFIMIGSAFMVFVDGINFGIDFKGGFLIEARTPEPADFSALREKLGDLGLGDVKIQEFGSDRDIMIRIEQQPGGETAQNEAIAKIRTALGDGVDYRRVETVGPKISADLIDNALMALLWAMIGMLIYVWFRFEWQFSLCAIFALVHDTFAILGLYGLTDIEFNETAIIAILTTIGYSINDTVVIYDRIRENLRKYKKAEMPEIINRSINETLSRTTLTSSTTLMALLCLYFFGGPVIEAFILPIIVGVGFGTYSSICLASLLLLYFKIYRGDDSHLSQEVETV